MRSLYLNTERQVLKEYSRYEKLAYAELVREADKAGREKFRLLIGRLTGLLGRMTSRPERCCES